MPDAAFLAIECSAPTLRPGAQGLARVAVNDTLAQLVATFERPVSAQQRYLADARSYSLTGGQRSFPRVIRAEQLGPTEVLLHLDGAGDFSIYTLTVNGPDIDPFFASRKLRFRLACDDPFDCRTPRVSTSAAPEPAVAIDYLAKDYASFRQALLDFIPTRLPDWTERSEADIGMMLLELLAATADNLSYMQDRVANEAFLSTARQRRSVARHLALVGYELDEGAAATTWLAMRVNQNHTLASRPGLRVSTHPNRPDEPVIVFETLGTVRLRPEHNLMPAYDWGNATCCLPRSALSLALLGNYEHLQSGDYLLLDDGRGRRDVIRLTAAPEIVPADSIKAHPMQPLTIVRWSPATSLHADYCVRDLLVRGNLVVATHGETVSENLRALTDEQKRLINAEIATRKPGQRLPRQSLSLSQAPLAHLDPGTLALVTPPDQPPPKPSVDPTTLTPRSVSTLVIEVEGFAKPWKELRSLLDSQPDDQVFRLEIDDGGSATIVFGDNTFGLRPAETARITATYRLGGGHVGNIAADTLVVAQPRPNERIAWLDSVTNPLPARGGREPETREHARRFGPAGVSKPRVAVTAADYQAAAQDFIDANGQPALQRTNAAFRWTGSWLTVTLAADPRATEGLDPALRQSLLRFLDARRLAGYDLEVSRALYVPVELAIEFCLLPGFRAGDVQQELLQLLSNADLPGGQRGFFHPDNFSFGDSLYVSRLFAAIMAVSGIASAQITRLAPLRAARPDLDTVVNVRRGLLQVGANQIIRLDNDRNFPENGTLAIRAKGVGR